MIDAIVYVAISTILLLLLVVLIKQAFRKRKLLAVIAQLNIDKVELLKELQKNISERDLEKSEGFLNFIEKSRDWAFDYIEQVQEKLLEFDKVVGPIVEYQKTYGKTLGSTPHSNELDKVSAAYEELKTLLPQEIETKNN